MFALVSLLARAFAAPCPPPEEGVPTVAADGAAHVLAADDALACWWIVDDGGDPRVAARWERARRDPVALVALPDGRAVVVLVEPTGRVRLGVRTEGVGERRLPFDLPGVPTRIEAHPARPLVALVWEGDAWVVNVDTGAVSTGVDARAFSGGGSDARR